VRTHTHSTLFTADRVGVGSQRENFLAQVLTPGTRIARSTLGSMVELQVLAAGPMEPRCRAMPSHKNVQQEDRRWKAMPS